MDYKIIDKSKTAVWVYNQGEFRVPDYVRQAENPGTELIMIEPHTPTQIEFSKSLRANPQLIEIENPTTTDGIVPKDEKVKVKLPPKPADE